MEQPGALINPSDSLSPFPPHRRRLLNSETLSTFLRIHSLCHSPQPGSGDAFSVKNVYVAESEDKTGKNEAGLGNRMAMELVLEKGGASNEATEVRVDADDIMNLESQILSANGDASCLQLIKVAESMHEDKMETGEFYHGQRINEELSQETGFEISSFLEEKFLENSIVTLTTIDEPQNSLLESLLEDSETMRHADMNKEDHSRNLSKGFYLNMGENTKSPIPGSNEEVRSSVMKSNELQQIDLENSLSNFGLTNSTLCAADDEDVEEGEISGDLEMDDELIDFLYEEEQTSEPIVNGDHITSQNQKGTIEVETKNEQSHFWDVAVQKLADTATTNEGDLSIYKDAGVQKKRKRGPMTQEKRAKKKKKERIKRAEKNRQLGVKRLKIQPPVMKPKTIEYCRHYLKGRCQEGDKCKFSHDITPLTKSKPCCHFARNSCMKGDDCPFDHQLSKYPCNNKLTSGFCSRGADCLFSHEVQSTGVSPSSVNASSSEVQLSWVTNPDKKMSSHNTSNLKVDPKSSSAGISSSKNALQKIAEIKLKATAPAPKGISKLLFGKSSLGGNESKPIQAGTSSKADSNIRFPPAVINSTLNIASNLNGASKILGFKQADILKFTNLSSENKKDLVANVSEMPKKTPSMPPRGINFLSFGKSPVNNNSGNMMIATPSTADNGASSSSSERERFPNITDRFSKGTPNSALKALLSNGPSSAQKALQSTLAFAAKYESIKMDQPIKTK